MAYMTKAQEKAAQVLANRKSAYIKKFRALIGHDLSTRHSEEEILKNFDVITAEELAANVASKEPVGLCIFPMKADAVLMQEKITREYFASLLAPLEEHDGDIDAAYPYPDWRKASWSLTNKEEMQKLLHNLVSSVTKDDKTRPMPQENARRSGHYYKRVVDREAVERKVAEAMRDAATLYDAFIVKMVVKVGKVESASISGSHIWESSFLNVTKEDGSTECWKTQQIINRSKFGMPFNQWPSRKVK